jgi:AraC family ethanolamine operon transcriptional activator
VSELHVTRVGIDGFEDIRRLLDERATTCVPLGSAAPRGILLLASIGEVLLRAGELAADIRARAGIEGNSISFSMKLHSDSTLFSFRSGKEVLPGDVYRLAHGDVCDYRVSGHLAFAVISIDAHLLLEYGAEDALRGEVGFWEQSSWFRAPPYTRDRVARSVWQIISQVSQPQWSVTGQALRQLQSDLIEPFLLGILSDERLPQERHGLSSAAIVRNVEEWVDDRAPETIQIADLCQALHISRRTLHRAFAETLGMGPSHYLTRRRCTAARAELREADPATVSVTDIATKYGFWQLGRFAREYRQLFGERPSDTLGKGSNVVARFVSGPRVPVSKRMALNGRLGLQRRSKLQFGRQLAGFGTN